MTFEEAKKILKKEGYELEKVGIPCSLSIAFTAYESPEICEAMQVVCSAGYAISMKMRCFNARKARLKKEYEKNTKAPGPGEAQPEEGNLALKESAYQFNDALLNEQAKEIESLRDKCKKLVDIIDSVRAKLRELKAENSRIKNSDLNLEGLIYATRELKEKNKKIEELTKEKTNLEDQIAVLNACKEYNENFGRKQIKNLGKEIARLNKIIHKKNLKIEELKKESSEHLDGKVKYYGETVDLSQELYYKNEELRLAKIREKNLTEVCQKYVKENEELKEKLKSINMNRHNERICKKQLAEKDEVIADLGKELSAQKDLVDDISLKYDGAKYNLKLRMDECEKLKEELEEANNRIKAIHNASKEYCYYGIAAEKMIQKMADVIVYDRPVSSKDFEKYRLLANGYRFNPQLPEIGEEEKKKFSPVKDTHPTEDNPEEVKMNEILEHVRKVLEEGGTVTTSYDKAEEGGDQSATIVQHRKSIVDLFKEIKRLWQE